jgi:ribonuclease P protein component
MKLVTLKKRRDFVLSNKHGQKTHNKNFILQEYCNPNIADKGLMFGFTATKRIGNAVKRNRAKRRMRALISLFLKENRLLFDETSSYIIVAKKSLIKASFLDLRDEMKECLSKL